MSPPPHASATLSAQGPVAGPSLVQTSTPNSPGAVTATFGSGSKSNASLDDTIHGYVDLGDVSDSDVIFMGDQPMPQDTTSGDDSDTMDPEDLNQSMRSHTQDDAGADADDEDNAPDAHDQGRPCFFTANPFLMWTRMRRDRKVMQNATARIMQTMMATTTLILSPPPPRPPA